MTSPRQDSRVINNANLLPSLLGSGVFLLWVTASVFFFPVRGPPFESHMIFRVSRTVNTVLQRCQKKVQQMLGWSEKLKTVFRVCPPHYTAELSSQTMFPVRLTFHKRSPRLPVECFCRTYSFRAQGIPNKPGVTLFKYLQRLIPNVFAHSHTPVYTHFHTHSNISHR